MDQMSHPSFVPYAGAVPVGPAVESTRWAGAAATVLLVLWSAVEVLLVGADLLRARVIDEIGAVAPGAQSGLIPADSLVALVGLVRWAVFVCAGVAFCTWMFKARASADRLADYPHRWGLRPWLVLGWVVPVANLWIPRQMLDDIWQASAGRSARQRPLLLLAWWGCFVPFQIGDRILARVTDGGGLDQSRMASLAEAGLAVPGLAAALLAVLVIWKINGLQVSTAQHIATAMAAHGQGMPATAPPPHGPQWPGAGGLHGGPHEGPHGVPQAAPQGDGTGAGWAPVQ